MDPDFIMNSNYELPFKYSKWFVLTSACFFVPTVKHFLNQNYFYAIITLSNAVASINYWRNTNNGMRRMVDLSVGRATFAYSVYASRRQGFEFFVCVVGIPTFYLISHWYEWKKSKLWMPLHWGVHGCATLAMLFIQ
jgi:hypothetical protein